VDFFGGGVVKDAVYCKKVQNVNEFRVSSTVRVIEFVTNEMLAITWRDNEYGLDVYRATNGAHIEIY
jgi:hypothetical protein